eukprot:10574-Heterococcus_DN1.PRE.6
MSVSSGISDCAIALQPVQHCHALAVYVRYVRLHGVRPYCTCKRFAKHTARLVLVSSKIASFSNHAVAESPRAAAALVTSAAAEASQQQ